MLAKSQLRSFFFSSAWHTYHVSMWSGCLVFRWPYAITILISFRFLCQLCRYHFVQKLKVANISSTLVQLSEPIDMLLADSGKRWGIGGCLWVWMGTLQCYCSTRCCSQLALEGRWRVLMCVDGHAAMLLLHDMLLAGSGQRGGEGWLVSMGVDEVVAMLLLHEMLLADSGREGGLVGINGCG